MNARARRERGFSFVELAIVIMIGGLLLAIGIPAVQQYVERSRVLQSVVEIGDMSKTIKQFERTTGALPESLDDAGYGGKLDPWSHPYEYLNLRTSHGNGQARKDKKLKPLNSDFDLYSIGPDGLTNASLGNSRSRDDVVRARDGSFVGTAQEFDP
ncbi:MAG: prepilin-type N-terminal cleavage/methylation domain-containing protein [Usitatibacter sp.]